MQPLEYETPHAAARPSLAALLVLPGIASCLSLFFIIYSGNNEPFMVFDWGDAVMHVAAPLVVLVLWIFWSVQARDERSSVFAVVPLVIFGVLKLCFIFLVGISYFFEGWNT